MPTDATTEDLIERIIFIQKIEEGIKDVDLNNVVNESEVDNLIEKQTAIFF
ncbi:MAG: hypothetical protein ACOYMA_21070 [Bacteroidia bacterium]